MSEDGARRRPWVKIVLVALPLWLALSGAVGIYLFLRADLEYEQSTDFQIPAAIRGERLMDDVDKLSVVLGERNFRDEVTRRSLRSAAKMIEGSLGPQNTGFRVNATSDELAYGERWSILWVEIPGKAAAGEVVWVFAGYDSPVDSAGLERNATGVAALLALAQSMVGSAPERTVRIAFVPHAYEDGFDLRESARIFSKMTTTAGGTVVQVVHVHGMGRGRELSVRAGEGQALAGRVLAGGQGGAGAGASAAGEPVSALPGLLASEWNLPVGEVTTVGGGEREQVADIEGFELAVAKLRSLIVGLAMRQQPVGSGQ